MPSVAGSHGGGLAGSHGGGLAGSHGGGVAGSHGGGLAGSHGGGLAGSHGDHAGSPGSPLLSHALAVTQDATIGYWRPDPATIPDPPVPSHLNSLEYLSPIRRGQILLGDLAGRFAVVPGAPDGDGLAHKATVSVGATEICTVQAPTLDTLKRQLSWVRNYADLRDDRIAEITIQTGDILSFFGSVSLLNLSRRKKTLELLTIVQSLAIHLEMQVKHYCWRPRPIDFAEEVQPVIQTPDHSTFPSGHAVESFAIATVLHRLKTDASASDGISDPAMVFRIAHRIATNRVIAGVHFPVDSAAGAVLGCTIGEAVHGLAIGDDLYTASYEQGAAQLPDDGDFTLPWLAESYPDTPHADSAAGKSDLFATLWRAARDEWQDGVNP